LPNFYVIRSYSRKAGPHQHLNAASKPVQFKP
jgi:hypothetical protein